MAPTYKQRAYEYTRQELTSGTPAGIGASREPPVFLKSGDVVEFV